MDCGALRLNWRHEYAFGSCLSQIVQKLGNNIGGYRGKTLDIKSVLADMDRAATTANWTCDHLDLPPSDPAAPFGFTAYRRIPINPRRRLYISTGIHGDEPAGPLAVLQLLRENLWPADMALWLCPCLNPAGFTLNRRENPAGIDINRDYRHFQSAEARAHAAWLETQPQFDFSLCLHEDWESQGFYLYETNPHGLPSFAEKIIDNVAAVCPIDRSPVIEGWPAQNGIIRPLLKPEVRPQWPEALYLIAHQKTRMGCTLEAPSDFPMPARVAALVTAVRTVLKLLQAPA